MLKRSNLRLWRKIHFRRRFQERLGFVCTDEIYKKLLESIPKGATFYKWGTHSSGTTSEWKIDLNCIGLKTNAVIVYDTVRKELVSIYL